MNHKEASVKPKAQEISRSEISGMTFMEVLVSAVIAALIVGATMSAFVTALNISLGWKGPILQAKAAAFNQQTLERFRNRMACDDVVFDANCDPDPTKLPTNWTSDPLPPGSLPGGTRQLKVNPLDCDGVEGAGDCLQVMVKVQWTPPQ